MQSDLGSKCSLPLMALLFSSFHKNFLAISQLSVVFDIFCNAVTPVHLHKKLRTVFWDEPYWHCNTTLVFGKSLFSICFRKVYIQDFCGRFSILFYVILSYFICISKSQWKNEGLLEISLELFL